MNIFKQFLVISFVFCIYQNAYSELSPHCIAHLSESKKFIYFVVPKTGYTSLRTLLETNQVPMTGQLQGQIELDNFSDYFKFAFVRNPWERLVSTYENLVVTQVIPQAFSTLKGASFETFMDYISRCDVSHPQTDVHIRLQTSLMPKNIDFIGRFENLREDLELVMAVLGLENQEIPHENKSDHVHYSHYYNERNRQIIAEKYKEDIETFGYVFEEDSSSDSYVFEEDTNPEPLEETGLFTKLLSTLRSIFN